MYTGHAPSPANAAHCTDVWPNTERKYTKDTWTNYPTGERGEMQVFHDADHSFNQQATIDACSSLEGLSGRATTGAS